MLSRQISATAMNDVAHNYFVHGRHADAFVMRRKALDFRRRVLHPDHIEIGNNYAGWSHAWLSVMMLLDTCVYRAVVL